MSASRPILAAISALVILLGSTAAEAGPRERARRLFREGRDLYSWGKYTDALAKFREARELFPSYKIDLSIGYTLEAMGEEAKAAVHYEQFLLKHAKKASEKVAAEGFGKLKKLRKRLARLTVTTPVRGAVIKVDGKEVARTPHRGRLYFEPGRHKIVVRLGEEVLHAKQVEVEPGGHVVIRVNPKLKQPNRTSPAWVSTGMMAKRDRPRSKPYYKTWRFWTLVSAAVVGTTVGIAVGTMEGDDRLPTGDSGTIILH